VNARGLTVSEDLRGGRSSRCSSSSHGGEQEERGSRGKQTCRVGENKKIKRGKAERGGERYVIAASSECSKEKKCV